MLLKPNRKFMESTRVASSKYHKYSTIATGNTVMAASKGMLQRKGNGKLVGNSGNDVKCIMLQSKKKCYCSNKKQ